MRTRLLLIAATVAGFAAARTDATQITLSTGPIAAYNNTTDFTPVPFNPTLNPPTTGIVYEIPLYFQVSELAPGESFGNVAIHATLTGDLSLNVGDAGPYIGDMPYYPLGKSTVPYFVINSDFGENTRDLQGIVATIPAGVTSGPRLTMGIGSPFLLGWVYVKLPATATQFSAITITPYQYSGNFDGVLTFDYAHTTKFVGVTVSFPEPASLGITGAGVVALLTRRRRLA